MLDRLMVFNGRSTYYLAKKICQELRRYPGLKDFDLLEPHVVTFDNDNMKVKINESVRGADVFVIQSAVPSHLSAHGINVKNPDNEGVERLGLSDSILELLILVDALRSASAGRITVVLPYFPYVRSDKKDEPRISISARLMGDLLSKAGADRFLTVNLHALQIIGFFSEPCDQLDANYLISQYFKNNFDTSRMGVVATDAGGVKIATVYAQALNRPLAICDKRRTTDKKDPEIRSVIGISQVKDQDIAIFDDEIMTGGTMAHAIRALRDQFDLTVTYVSCIHPVFAKGAMTRIFDAGVRHIITTDTLPLPPSDDDRIHVVSTAPLLAGAIYNIHTHSSISQIFRENEEVLKSVPRRDKRKKS